MATIEILHLSHDYFPEIEFGLVNDDSSEIACREFTLVVLEARLDLAPHFDFKFWVSDRSAAPNLPDPRPLREQFRDALHRPKPFGCLQGCLSIQTLNHGWGPALDAIFALSEPTLDALFDERERRFACAEISAGHGAFFPIVSTCFDNDHFLRLHQLFHQEARDNLERELADQRQRDQNRLSEEACLRHEQTQRRAFERRWRDQATDQLSRSAPDGQDQAEGMPTIPLENLTVRWRCRGSSGLMFTGSGEARPPQERVELSVGLHGLILVNYHSCIVDPSGPGRGVVINVDHGPQKRVYSILELLPASDRAVFRMRLGASKSCDLQLQFIFKTDRGQVVCSDRFWARIWCPSQSGYYLRDLWASSHESLEAQNLPDAERSKRFAELDKVLGSPFRRLPEQSSDTIS